MKRFQHIDTWVFDLDNTLYNAEERVFVEMADRMGDFISNLLNIPKEEAAIIRHNYWQKYGTTLRGLMNEHDINPHAFLDYVHEFDVSQVPSCNITQEYLSHLPGRKIIFTNAPQKFAAKMVNNLGLNHHFDDIFTIEDADFQPKPNIDTYHKFIDKFQFNPKSACMFEDMQINLKPAADVGMTTVWVHGQIHQGDDFSHVHHKDKNLADWLQSTIKKD